MQRAHNSYMIYTCKEHTTPIYYIHVTSTQLLYNIIMQRAHNSYLIYTYKVNSLETLCLCSCIFLLKSTFSASELFTLALRSLAVLHTVSFSLISSFKLRLRSNICLRCSSPFSSAIILLILLTLQSN